MKKTYTISIGGQIFHTEEDAGDKLQAYIQTLEKHYFQEEGGQEIMNDIENRIAELLQEATQKQNTEVVTLEDIQQVIQILGNPDDIISEDYTETVKEKTPRKLYRDLDRNMLGGVAAGIANYFHISLAFVRFLFLLLTFFYGVTFIVYIILWIVLPPALTAKQKLEMKGEKINILNIEKNIRNGISDLKENGKVQEGFKKTGGFISEILIAIGRTLLKILKIILKILAGILWIFSIIIALLLVAALIPIHLTGLPFSIPTALGIFGLAPAYSIIAVFLICIIPFILLIWLTSKYLFRFKNRNYYFPLTLTILWITSALILCLLIFTQMKDFSGNLRSITIQSLPISAKKEIVVIAKETYSPEYRNRFNTKYIEDKNTRRMLGAPRLQVTSTLQEEPTLTVTKRVYNNFQNTEKIDYQWALKNDTLWLDHYFSAPKQSVLYKQPKVTLRLQLPETYSIVLDPSVNQSMDVENLPEENRIDSDITEED
ncbi:PspC domain-containing protein [Odoribacter laneus]|uniref:Uncharacterized protein n=1 Tax=Odoribacter laneus YIT 12061 TaxID=742817 RepID=H1DHT3_9BACT|nr:PspC domain-containing protein [Odoribacter laneus]EHP47212.1 hypothetical protein HMPREF9449_01819 [Odoribacter laneus YIT 12061]